MDHMDTLSKRFRLQAGEDIIAGLERRFQCGPITHANWWAADAFSMMSNNYRKKMGRMNEVGTLTTHHRHLIPDRGQGVRSPVDSFKGECENLFPQNR